MREKALAGILRAIRILRYGFHLQRVPAVALLLTGLLIHCPGAVSMASDRDAPSSTNSQIRELHIAYTAGVLNGINQRDAIAAIEVWFEVVGREREVAETTAVQIFDSLDELVSAVEIGAVDVVTLLSEELFILGDEVSLEPIFTPCRGDEVEEHIVMLVRHDSDIDALAKLRNRVVAVPTVQGEALATMWLDRELRNAGLEAHDTLISGLVRTDNASRAILSVFFGTNDVCLVAGYDFETAVELNPQLGRELSILARSPGFSVSITCLRRGDWAGKDNLIQSLQDLHTKPSGEQILLLFKTGQLVPFQPAHLDGTRLIIGGGP